MTTLLTVNTRIHISSKNKSMNEKCSDHIFQNSKMSQFQNCIHGILGTQFDKSPYCNTMGTCLDK